jgi:hypothetical protein
MDNLDSESESSSLDESASERRASLLQTLLGFFDEHRHCGDTKAPVRHGDGVELACACGAVVIEPLAAPSDDRAPEGPSS